MTWTHAVCGRRGCLCTHDNGCDRGWIDLPDTTKHGVTYARVAPCPICRPWAAARLEQQTMAQSRNLR